MRTWIKFCATTSIEDAAASVDAGADALGFVFAPGKRRVTPEQARDIAAGIPPHVERIGVFQDEPADLIRAIVDQVGLTGVQLHGKESPEFTRGLFDRLPRRPKIGIIKTIIVGANLAEKLSAAESYGESVDCFLLDSGAGSGKTFEWQKAKEALGHFPRRIIIAGGLNPENAGEAVKRFSPWGVDVVTGVERQPGRKDPEKLKAFVAAVRKAERS